jgi:hypothetical protein
MDGTTDTDGDGLLDINEFAAGTDATNQLDFLEAAAGAEPAVNEGRVIRWHSAEGRTYSLLRAPSLFDAFVPIATNLPATPPENVYTDIPVSADTLLFYRLRLE